MNLPLAVAGDIVADLEHFRKIIAGPLVGIVLGVVDVRRRGRQDKRLQKRVRLHHARAVRVKTRLHANKTEAVIEPRGLDPYADSAAKRALERNFHGPFALRPDAAAGLYDLRFPVQLVFQPHAAGKTANWEDGWVLYGQLRRAGLAFAEVYGQLHRQLELFRRAEIHRQKQQRQQNQTRRQPQRNGAFCLHSEDT